MYSIYALTKKEKYRPKRSLSVNSDEAKVSEAAESSSHGGSPSM